MDEEKGDYGEAPAVSSCFFSVMDSRQVVILRNVTKQLRTEMGLVESVHLATVGNMDKETVRKVAEATFRKSGKKIFIMIPKKENSRNETLVVKSEGKTFAELVKGVKEAVGLEEGQNNEYEENKGWRSLTRYGRQKGREPEERDGGKADGSDVPHWSEDEARNLGPQYSVFPTIVSEHIFSRG